MVRAQWRVGGGGNALDAANGAVAGGRILGLGIRRGVNQQRTHEQRFFATLFPSQPREQGNKSTQHCGAHGELPTENNPGDSLIGLSSFVFLVLQVPTHMSIATA